VNYTVILLYPDYVADSYGHDTYMDYCSTPTPEEAVQIIREDACKLAAISDPGDLYVIAVIEGAHNDLCSGSGEVPKAKEEPQPLVPGPDALSPPCSSWRALFQMTMPLDPSKDFPVEPSKEPLGPKTPPSLPKDPPAIRCMDVSTGHITERDNELLLAGYHIGVSIMPTSGGWIIPTAKLSTDQEGLQMSITFHTLLSYAREEKYDYLWLDMDGARWESFPEFDW